MFSPYSNPCSAPMKGSEHFTPSPSVFTRHASSRASASRFYRAIALQVSKHCTPSRRNVLRRKVLVSGSITGNQFGTRRHTDAPRPDPEAEAPSPVTIHAEFPVPLPSRDGAHTGAFTAAVLRCAHASCKPDHFSAFPQYCTRPVH